MAILNKVTTLHGKIAEWRHDIHAHPETAFEERRTPALVAQEIDSFGLRARNGR